MTESDHADYERFVRYFAKHEASVRSFVRTMISGQTHVDEIMQEVSVVAWRKFDAAGIENGEQFVRWTCTIARFEVLRYRSSLARDRLVFDADVIEMLAEDAIDEISLRQRQRAALSGCLARLGEKHRVLVMQAYSAGASIRKLAESNGQTPAALYQSLRRIRQKLMECIDRSIRLESAQ